MKDIYYYAFVNRAVVVVLVIVFACIGSEYDTSSSLLFSDTEHRLSHEPSVQSVLQHDPHSHINTTFIAHDPVSGADYNQQEYPIFYSVLKGFVRWDAVYFLSIADRGYIYENEHAFFPGLPILLNFVNELFSPFLSFFPSRIVRLTLSGIFISNFFFILAAAELYQ